MIFEPPEERAALVESAQRFVAERYPPETHLARIESAQSHDPERWRDIAEMGWLTTDLPTTCGGLGLGFSLLGALAESLAPALLQEPFLTQSAIAGFILGEAGSSSQRLLDDSLGGSAVVALAHHETREERYYSTSVASEFVEEGDSIVLQATKAVVLDGAGAGYFLVSARDTRPPHALGVLAVPGSCRELVTRCYQMFDGRHLCDLEIRAARLPATSKLALRRGAEDVLDDALERYALLVAADSLGIMRTLVALSARHLDERVQFGQKIGNFQALQHRLVDMQLRLVRAESLVESAYMLAEAAAGNAAAAIAAARVGCEDAGIFIAEHAVQLHGAMGMTNEFIVGHYLKRLTANRFVAGDRAEHFARFGALRD